MCGCIKSRVKFSLQFQRHQMHHDYAASVIQLVEHWLLKLVVIYVHILFKTAKFSLELL